ncbi:MAG: head-tail adaptor protein [Sphingomonas sp.]|uniref:head-tail adaptor protein n=1 Tax=Sphingomonas sp. TaxID=28214 RepID=UPI0018560A67|nr:head-tail adaptor protein [Sphingomonas sp.]MBA3667761.1 head-tail adaptor protein [Sphingomonas sp.]
MSGEFAGTLKERVRIERPVTLRTAAGLQEAGWETVARCLAAIVAEGVGAEAEGQALSALPRFRVTIRRREGIAIGQRVAWGERTMLIRQRIDDPKLPDRILLRCEEMR